MTLLSSLLFILLFIQTTFSLSINSLKSQNGQTFGRAPAKAASSDNLGILPPNYYANVAPSKDDNPVIVNVSVVILNMKLSSTAAQTLDVDLFFHNSWIDHRLLKPTNEEAISTRANISNKIFTQYKLGHVWHERLWTPDTYFRNVEHGQISNVLTPTYYFTVTNYNEIFMAVRLSLQLSCRMNFAKV